jgi:hypothetical protein
MVKPLVRWTFGMASDLGLEILLHSVKRFRQIYPEFDCVVCCNNTKAGQIEAIERLHVRIYRQNPSDFDYPLEPPTSPPGWKGMWPHLGIKLCPPRLNPEGHEWWIDNDIVIRDRLPTVDKWLTAQKCMIAEGHGRQYGRFEPHVPPGIICSGGFFGVPPNLDLGSALLAECCQVLHGSPLAYFDEQGLVTKTMTQLDHLIVPMSEIFVVKTLPDKPLPPALHFIGTNRTNQDKNWSMYKDYSSYL